MTDITRIVIHHSASPHGRGDDAATIHQWHQERGFDGIGYHWVILESGKVEAGRPWYWQGAHAAPFNENSLGICLIGDGEFNTAQFKALKALLRDLIAGHPGAAVMGHRDVNSDTKCPGFEVRDFMEDVLLKTG